MAHSFFNYRRGMEPVPGYTLLDRLGEGGFGEVWRANAPGQIPCALKIMDLTGKEGLLEFRSLRLVRAIDHANVNPITGIWLRDDEGRTVDDSQWSDQNSGAEKGAALQGSRSVELIIAMRLCMMSLHRLMQEYKKLGYPGILRRELLVYMQDAARAIDYLNSAKHIVHSDIKPQNILVSGRESDQPGTASICDFGLARVIETLQKTQEAPVTVFYAAPEAFKGKSKAASDQYSLAISYVELRTGKLPFPQESQGSFWEIYEAHKSGQLDLSMLEPAERDVIARGTHIDPDQRWKNCQELVGKLREACEMHGSPFEPIPAIELPEPSQETSLAEDFGSGSGGDVTRYSPTAGMAGSGRPGTVLSGLGNTTPAPPDSGNHPSKPIPAPTLLEKGSAPSRPKPPITPSASEHEDKTLAAAAPSPEKTPSAKNNLAYGVAGLLALAILIAGPYAYFSQDPGKDPPNSPEIKKSGTPNLSEELPALLAAGNFDGAVRTLREHESQVTQAELASAWKSIEETWRAAADTAVRDSAPLDEVERLFATGRAMKRSSLTSSLTSLFQQRARLHFNGGNFSGVLLLLNDPQHPDRNVLSQPDIDQIQSVLSEEWKKRLVEKINEGAANDSLALARFLQQLRPDDAQVRLWLARALLRNEPEQASRALAEIRPDRLENDDARSLQTALAALTAAPPKEANADHLKALGKTLATAMKLAAPYQLNAWEREQLAARVAGHVALATSRAKELLAEGKGNLAEPLLAAVAAADSSNAEALLLQIDRFISEQAWEKAAAALDQFASAAPKREPELAPRRSVVDLHSLPLAKLEPAVRRAQTLQSNLAADNPWLPKLTKSLADCGLRVAAETQAAIQSPALPSSDDVAARLAITKALGASSSPELLALAVETKVAGAPSAELASVAAAVAADNPLAGYLKFVAAADTADALAKANAPAEKWISLSDRVRSIVPPSGKLPAWIIPPRASRLALLANDIIAKRGLELKLDAQPETAWLSEGFNPFGDKAKARETFELQRVVARLRSVASKAPGEKPPEQPDMSRELALAALFSEPAEPVIAKTILAPLVPANAIAQKPLDLWNAALVVQTMVAETNPATDELMQRTENLLVAFSALYPPAAEGPRSAEASALLSRFVRPAVQATRARTPASANDAHRAQALAIAEFAWKYRGPDGWPSEPAASTMAEALGSSFTPAQATPRSLLLGAIGRIRQSESDPVAALNELTQAMAAAPADSPAQAAVAVTQLAALASLPELGDERKAQAAAAAKIVSQAIEAKRLPNEEFSLPSLRRLQAWSREADDKLDEALQRYQQLRVTVGEPTPPNKLLAAQLHTDSGRCLTKKLRHDFPQLFAPESTAAIPDSAKPLLENALRELRRAAELDAPVPQLAEARANLARLLTLDPPRRGEAQVAYLQAVQIAASRPAEANLYLKEWARLPLLPKPAADQTEAAPAPEKIAALLSQLTQTESKSYLRLTAAKAYFRQLPADPVYGAQIEGNFPAAKVYFDGYTPPSKLSAIDLEWLRLRMVANLGYYNPEKDNIRMLESARNDADYLVDESNLKPSDRALALASRGIANAIIANQDLQVQVARSAYRDLTKAIEMEPSPPTRWRIHLVNSMAFAQKYAVESARPSQHDQQAAIVQAEKAIDELKKTGKPNYAQLINDLEKKKTAIRFPPRK